MVPLVGSVMELHLIRDEADTVLRRGRRRSEGVRLDIPIGTMIELPRAALTAGRIAEAADFFSFGTNDLTQTAWGFSRDDVEAAFFAALPRQGRVHRVAVRDPRRHRGRAARAHRRRGGPRAPVPASRSGSAASTAATPSRCTSSTRSAWTTSPAARSGCRSPGWRPVGPPSPRTTPPKGSPDRADHSAKSSLLRSSRARISGAARPHEERDPDVPLPITINVEVSR